MNRQLFLLRHAKSSWDYGQLEDIDRPLSERGKRAAKAIGKYMASNGLMPATVLCSTAERTRQTWSIVAQQLNNPPSPSICPELYEFGNGDAALDCIRKAPGADTPLMIIAHNPALHSLAQRLITRQDTELHHRLAAKFPTCTLAVISFNAYNWHDILENTGKLEQFIRPKDLDKAS
jgi:phosphohistidine phosphatase